MKKRYSLLLFFTGTILLLPSCLDDLDTVPLDDTVLSSEKIYKDPNNYVNVLAKCYMGLAVGGNEGGDGSSDISGIDGGFSQYLRQLWYHQELTTDEAIITWNDQTIKDLHYQTWTPSDPFVTAMYYRVMFQATMCNELIRNTSPSKLDERGIGSQYRETFAVYQAEARFLRALSYWHGLDMFRKLPFVTENDAIGAIFPEQKDANFMFQYIESELIAITDGQGGDDLLDARTNEYARADKAAAYMLLAKLYLNAEVYIGENKYVECITTLEKVLGAGYTLEPKFTNLFRTDNNNSDEVIFPIAFDGLKTQTWGGTTILVHAAIGGLMGTDADGKANTDSMKANYGVGGGWGGLRTTKEVVAKFGDITTTNDSRSIFFTNGQNLEIENVGLFTDGYAVPKFLNLSSTGASGQHNDYVDTDFPMFRLADAYLMYAEANLRGGGGSAATALNYVNELRQRAYGDNSGDITSGQLTLNFILDERLKELMWEGHRRTDLVRFGKFTGSSYIWAWKGFVKDGAATDSYRDVFPIPVNDLNANPKLKQNEGYN
ncbi:MAG: RagB/SusD family nutrient uptake outer membrane protein [Salinivirgaceae bacterium]|jgi:hypothetical protein